MTTDDGRAAHDWRARGALALIGLAVVAGALLRLVANDQPFSSSDHAELAAIVTFFYPRDLQALGLSSRSTWNILLNGHGVLPPLIGIVATTLLGLGGVRINEFWWNLPFALSSLVSIPLAALLTTRLAGRVAGVGAAALIALLPIHAALSRTSGVSHIPLMFVCQLFVVLCFVSYFQQPSPQRARRAALALATSLLVELFFPLLFVLVFGVGLLTVESEAPGLRGRVARVRALISQPRAMLLPLAVLCFNFALMLAYSAGLVGYGGLAARLLEGSDRKAGLYLGDFLANAGFVVGTPALVLLGALGLANAPALWRLEARAVPLLWAVIYLVPFVAFTRPNVYGYLLLGVAPLALNAAIMLGRWWHERPRLRAPVALAFALLLGFFTLRALSMIFSIDVPLAGGGQAQGAVSADQGLKAAAWWIRARTPPDALIFADAAYEPYQVAYYLHRPFLAVTDAQQPEEAYRLLDGEPRQPAYYLVLPGDEELLRAHARAAPQLVATVTVEQRPALLIYGYAAGAPQLIDAHAGNQQFDAQFGSWRAMFAIGTAQ
jgi:hypothetical protein